MSSQNTALWDMLGKTDPAHTKGFTRGGGFKGTAIRPIWSFRRMTEQFGPCGTGWGVGEPSFQVVPGSDGEVLVYCTASVWYTDDDTISRTVYGVGGDKVVGKNKHGLNSDDEAFKKAYTDALTNALKLIGVGADVHMGLFEDNKYVADLKQEFADPAPKPKREPGFNANGNRSARSLKQEGVWQEFEGELLECSTVNMLTKLALAWSAKAEADKWPEAWKDAAREEINKRKTVIQKAVEDAAEDADDFPGDRPLRPGDNAMADSLMGG